MLLLLRAEASPASLLERCKQLHIEAHLHRIGNRWAIQIPTNGHQTEALFRYEEVERILSDEIPYPLVQRWEGSVQIGEWRRGSSLLWIAGPCSVESRAQLVEVAYALKEMGVHVLRGGAYKARTSPYSFQGLGEEAIEWLLEVKALTALPLCVEILSERHLPLYDEIDLLQIGARNMDNYQLLQAVALQRKPILLKRNPQATVQEWLLAAEYLLLYGAPWVLLCERGIRSFERSLRYTLDVGAIPVAQRESRLPIIADPSHAAGDWRYVEPLALAAIAAGAEGLIVEVHPNPSQARSDAAQQLTIEQFKQLVQKATALCAALSRS
ncbi:MAG: 3-deoxy-7-phosphoheptulonate synthase [Bacteroidia bacterium]|nr:3-deoxy-7-phosphoheptulonate synthase [Bacteroidia bacterium]MDW8014954.1 3-deoxy-7-phosphoheptulonate synthase [Bacteroidia bacterium]